MIYVEYIERDRFLPLEIFRQLGDQSAWVDPDDTLVGSFGRTMRLGPMPSYLAFWKCKGMKRMDEWEAHFNSPEAQFDVAERATHRAIHLQYGGCYDELITGPAVDPASYNRLCQATPTAFAVAWKWRRAEQFSPRRKQRWSASASSAATVIPWP